MRTAILILLAAAFAAGLSAPTRAQAPVAAATFEPGVARPGGVYATLPLGDAAACAAACAQDSLCMSWTYLAAAPGACELKAVIPHPVENGAAVSGLSARAPAFARLVTRPEPIGAPRDLFAAPAPPAPSFTPAFSEPVSASIEEPVAAADEPPLQPRVRPDDAPILLSADTAPLPLRERASDSAP